MTDDRIHKEDLFLMMESYKNMIESNVQLMEKQDNTLTKMNLTCQSIGRLTDNISVGFNEIREKMKGVDNHHIECSKAQRMYNDNLKVLIQDGQLDITKKHFGQNIKVYGLIGTLCTIIIALIGLIYKLWPTTQQLLK